MFKASSSDSSLELVKQLISNDHGNDHQEPFPVDRLLSNSEYIVKWTPLQLACRHGAVKVASFLINAGASINITDKIGKTPLFIACEWEQLSIVSLLIKKGALINAANFRKRTPLFVACKMGNELIVRELLSSGAEWNESDCHGSTPLRIACCWARGGVVLEMFKHLAEKLSREDFRLELKHAREWWTEAFPGRLRVGLRKPLSLFLSEDVMESFEFSLADNRENNEKGAR